MKKFSCCFIYKQLSIFLFSLMIFHATEAQHLMVGTGGLRVETGFNFGPTFFLGDLGGHRGSGSTFIKDLNFPLTKFMKGFFVSVYPNDWLGFRVSGALTYLEGDDKIIVTHGGVETVRKDRNLDFKSNLTEVYTAIEFYPIMLLMSKHEDYLPKFRPYLFGGIGIFHFNPQGSLTDANGNVTWHYLHPLHTEGEGFSEYPNRPNYSLTQFNIPMGGGFKYSVSDHIDLGLELIYRKTFTDYIDDVSTTYIDPNLFYKYLSPADADIAVQINNKSLGNPALTAPGMERGNAKNNDTYFSFAFRLGIKLNPKYKDAYAREITSRTACSAKF